MAYFLSWMVFLNLTSEQGAKTLFATLSVQEILETTFNQPEEDCYLHFARVSRDEWREHLVGKYDSAFMMKIPGARERLARLRGSGVVEQAEGAEGVEQAEGAELVEQEEAEQGRA